MPLSESDLKYLWDMRGAGERAVAFVQGVSWETFRGDDMRQAAVERAVEIIGEAARHVTAEGRAALPGVQWRAIIATRHILAHEYGEVDLEKVWRIATEHVPVLLPLIGAALNEQPPGPESLKNPAEP